MSHVASRLKGTSDFFHCCASQEQLQKERAYFGSQSEGIAHHEEEVLAAGVRDGFSHCSHSQEAKEQQEGKPNYKTSRTTLSDPSLPRRLHPFKGPGPSKVVLPTRDQMIKYMSR